MLLVAMAWGSRLRLGREMRERERERHTMRMGAARVFHFYIMWEA
jgi:hypothetical protein